MSRKMKDSGVEWIGEIPEDWEVRKLGNVSNLYTGNSIKDSEKDNYGSSMNAIPYIATKDVGFNNKIDYHNGMYIKKKDDKFKRAYKDNTLICIEGGSAGRKIGKVRVEEVCFGNKLCCINSDVILNKYIYYYSLSPNFGHGFQSRITGLIPGVTLLEMAQIEIVLPSQFEQKLIIDFLDKKILEIDHIISKTKKVIEEYKTYKQSLITETVTKGLDQNVPMKDSGIEWIGEIPKHWGIERLKYSFAEHRNKNVGNMETNVLSLSYGNIVKRNIEDNFGLIPKSFETYNIITIGTIVLRLTDLQNDKKSWRVGYCNQKGIITSAYVSLANKNDSKTDSNYYYYFIHSLDYKKVFYNLGDGVRQGMSYKDIGNLDIILPPLPEQEQIASFLDTKCGQIDDSIATKEKLLTEMEAYKKSLIYETVTGKREVI